MEQRRSFAHSAGSNSASKRMMRSGLLAGRLGQGDDLTLGQAGRGCEAMIRQIVALREIEDGGCTLRFK